MKFLSDTLILRLFISFSLFVFSYGVLSQEGEFVHAKKPVGESLSGIKKRADLPPAKISGTGLKAIAIVGEVDGEDGPQTSTYVNNIKGVSKVLRDRGVTVIEFYPPANRWKDIKDASKGANFILYAGHGVGTNLDKSPYDQREVGGFALGKDFVSNEMLRSDLKPADGAVVLFLGACFTAGNMAYDMGVIRDEEVKKRISMYSQPFIKTGFKGYFATWAPWTAQTIIAQLFAGKSYGETYLSQTSAPEVTKLSHPSFENSELWYHTKPPMTKPIYDYAFVGSPNILIQNSAPTNSGTDTEPEIKPSPSLSPAELQKKNKQLFVAIYSKQEDKALQFLQEGADPNADYQGWRPLHLSIVFDLPNLVKELVRRKASLNFQVDGYTPLSLATVYEKPELVAILENAGATKSRAVSKKPTAPKL
ncbi:hypothetical protein CH373_07235 [Leptospira perolatii]|uniref:Uncharacterized protein n=1 Tax=Leptospira perolatii TaxID=2023191 RepID=A0A2M9ZPA9_9LEPT|nr:ankyrin repeat domain-containing protein [Leptospira perolatii]PJZ70713.1 hypothetical protein CH360_04095 [Leptospira perolatii]PJZ73922.1 hypothetical protein CH373_07235 [Leptospira perolatii]